MSRAPSVAEMNRQVKDMREAVKLMGKAAVLLGKSSQISAMVQLAEAVDLVDDVLRGIK